MFNNSSRELFRDQEINYRARWSTIGTTNSERVKNLVLILLESNMGKKIISEAKFKASKSGETLFDILYVGSSSLTDTTLTRKFLPESPTNVIYETKSVVYINQNLSIKNAVLDLAHELTHYVYREPFNPYKSSFTRDRFIKSTISGRGGEVDAFLTECEVLKDLFTENDMRNSNCSHLIDEDSGRFSRDIAISQFYKVGDLFDQFLSDTDAVFLGIVSSDRPIFISSAYGVPYPIAALREFESINQKVCLNDKRRLDVMRDNLRRTIASDDGGLTAKYRLAKKQHIAKCFR